MITVSRYTAEHEPVVVTETDVLDGMLATADTAELRRNLVEQRALLAEQTRMLEALDRRRMELEELMEVLVPIANGALQVATRRLDALERSALPARAATLKAALTATAAAPPPGLLQLLRRARAAETRRALALLLDVARAVGADDTTDDERPQGR